MAARVDGHIRNIVREIENIVSRNLAGAPISFQISATQSPENIFDNDGDGPFRHASLSN
ncbi:MULTISPECIES: hypothetical protein [Nitrospirillum]|uniref:hypothetical protein n=1 Tax=Nitrospirillum amazonense TaxID=28077 RepID=UPI0016450C62|nr:hypothetical protein [Nitrospirillum amazonense]MEC4593653.1 hypothetical protein [Nitrospirillum amazonense]